MEFAFILPIFMLLVMGIIDFAMAFNDYNSLRSGVAEAARQASVANYESSGCSGGSTAELVCMTKARTDLDASELAVMIDLPSTYEVGESVKICAMYQLDSVTGMFDAALGGKALKAESEMRLEKLDDVDALADYADPPLSGQSWSWC